MRGACAYEEAVVDAGRSARLHVTLAYEDLVRVGLLQDKIIYYILFQ